MPKRFELEGRRFGRVLVGAWVPEKMKWSCACDCGKTWLVQSSHLTAGNTTSCGCARADRLSDRMTTHGMSKTPTYKSWCELVARCTNPANHAFSDYGGRGIRVCDRWLTSFESFLEDMGERPAGDMSIDRIDVNGDYEPDNCRWATRVEQSNNRRNIQLIEFGGRRQTVTQWAAELGMPMKSLYKRIADGWSVERAFTTPIRKFAK